MTIAERIKRDINGLLLLDKPVGISSNNVLQKVKYLLQAKKAGHTGSLDPLASGMLPLCFGEATKFSRYLLEADKSYVVKAKLGIRTTTSDSEGEVVCVRPVPKMTRVELDQCFDSFRGEIQQVPSMFSALKYNGQPLYQLARQGITVPRSPRSIHIYSLTVLNHHDDMIEFQLHCSKGTYVRTIVDDFGERLGCGAHVVALRRLSVSGFQESQMHHLTSLEDHAANSATFHSYLLPITAMLSHLPMFALTESMAFYFRRGQAIQIPFAPMKGLVALQLASGKFIGVGEMVEDGKVAPRRIINE